MSAFRRLTDHERGRITLLLNQTDPPSVPTISKRFGLNPSTIYKIQKDAMRTGSKQIVANAETKAPEAWQMTHGELRDKLTPLQQNPVGQDAPPAPQAFP